MITALMLAAGIVLLVSGAEGLVRGASRLALAVGVSPLVIGLTVVAYGTSMPELAVSVKAALSGQADIAVGNVVGSNLCNILLILGLSAAVTPLVVNQNLVRKDVPIMIGVSVLTLLAALDGGVQRWEGLVLFLLGAAYTAYAILQSRRETREVREEYAGGVQPPPAACAKSHPWNLALILGGLGMLVLGSHLLVEAAKEIARMCGVSERVIGLTIVAVGTSLPELATSVLAAVRGQRDIAVGNVIGSNIFNILFVLGLSTAATPGSTPVSSAMLTFDIPVMIAVSVTCLPVFIAGHCIRRTEGILLLAYFAAYLAYLVLADLNHRLLTGYRQAMVYFAIPLTLIALGFSLANAIRRGEHRSAP